MRASAPPRCCSPPTTWPRSSASPIASFCWTRDASSRTRHRERSSKATARTHSKTCFSMSCAATPGPHPSLGIRRRTPSRKRHGKRHERASADERGRTRPAATERRIRIAPACGGAGPSLRLSAAQFGRPPGGAHLLAVSPDAHLGLPAEISGRDLEHLRPGRRRADRLGAAVGYSCLLYTSDAADEEDS